MGAVEDIVTAMGGTPSQQPAEPAEPAMGALMSPAYQVPTQSILAPAPPRFSDFRHSDNIEDRRNEPVTPEMQMQAMLQAAGVPQYGQQPAVGVDATTQWLNDYKYANRGQPMTDLQRQAGLSDLDDMAIQNKGAHLSDMASRGR